MKVYTLEKLVIEENYHCKCEYHVLVGIYSDKEKVERLIKSLNKVSNRYETREFEVDEL